MSRLTAKCFLSVLSAACTLAHAQVTYTGTTSDDAFLATGSPGNPSGTNLTNENFGAAGVLAVASAASVKGEFESVLKFNLTNATGLFNGTYGPNWTISDLSLELTGNFATAGAQPDNPMFNSVSGGNFVVEWMADDDWVEGTGRPNFPTADGVTYGSLPLLLSDSHEVLCTNTYVPPGDNVHLMWPLPLNVNLVSNIVVGGPVSFRLCAADDRISCLFNSHNFGNGNQPLIHITAIPRLGIFSGSFTNGFFHLVGIGGTNAPYQIQASSDLSMTNWQAVGTATADGTGEILFDDVTATNTGQRYYRLAD
jgi:hypothetical protein